MRRFGLTVSVVAGVAIAAIIASCSGGSDSIAEPGTDLLNVAGLNLNGGGWTPAVEAASNDKVTVCHSGNGKHFTQINVSAQGARAHLGEPATGRGGHAGDYRTTSLTPCPPPSTPGQLQVCKVAGVGVTPGTNFSFTVTANGQPQTVTVPAGAGPAGTCASAGSFPIGTTVSVAEVAQTGMTTASIVATPAGAQQGTSDLANRSATVIAGVGTTSLTFTNNGPSGTLVVCKVGGTGVTPGTNFGFTAGSAAFMVAAGAGPTGTCGAPITVPVGPLTVAETGSGSITEAIAGTPAPTNVNLPGRSATTQITQGQESRLTFTNVAATSANSGSLVICKVGGTGITQGANYGFTVAGQTVTVAAGAAPNGTCALALTLPVGAYSVVENAVTGTSVSAIGGTPALPTNINLAGRSATVQVNGGQETRITFTNTAP